MSGWEHHGRIDMRDMNKPVYRIDLDKIGDI
jgi:hypothetical protein